MKLCYVTAFLDIEREKWIYFQRSFEKYFDSFTILVDLFKKNYTPDYELIVFIDEKHYDRILNVVNNIVGITVIKIDNTFMQNNIPIWKRLEKETEIMNSDTFKNLLSHRLKYPEHNNPKYTLINHAKIDFVNLAIEKSNAEYFCWVDFGYFQNKNTVPEKLIDVNLLNKEKVNYTLINPLSDNDKSVFYTIMNAPERIGGFFFFGNRKVLKEYQTLFHQVHLWFQENNLADDDQHIALQCYFKNPELFYLHSLGEWHKALISFQRKLTLTEIMNKHGSDKGNGHHNYTEYYEKIFEPIRYNKINLLEIGIGTVNPFIKSNMCGFNSGNYVPGSSLRGWKEYFSNGEIYGCDIDESILFTEPRIHTFYLDQTKKEIIEKQICEKDICFDIIIDDGLHHFPTNWALLNQIFCKLNKNGIYIIEDIVDFDKTVSSKNFTFEYIELPNPKNTHDNNILIVRKL